MGASVGQTSAANQGLQLAEVSTTCASDARIDLDTINRSSVLEDPLLVLRLVTAERLQHLHLITSLHAVEQIARHLPAEQQSLAIKCYWTAMLGVLFALKVFPTKETLEDLHSRYANAIDAAGSPTIVEDWERNTERALQDREEHNAKLVYVLRKLWSRFGHRSIFRVAAGHFTVTPVVTPQLTPSALRTVPTTLEANDAHS